MGKISDQGSFVGSDSRSDYRSENQAQTLEASFEDAQVVAIDESVKIVFKSPAEAKGPNATHLRHQLQAARSEIELLRLKLELKD